MPEIISPGTGLSPITDKSVIPANNVFTLQDALEGKKYRIPSGGGDWSEMSPQTWGEDVGKSYKEDGGQYKREQMDMSILEGMLPIGQLNMEKWRVKVPGGAKTFSSYYSAQKYISNLKDKGISSISLTRIAQNNKAIVIAEALEKTFMVESINALKGVREIGSAFCIGPGLFLTCAHVISRYDKNNNAARKEMENVGISNNIQIFLMQNNQKYPAVIEKVNPTLDIALLRADIDVEPFELDNRQSITIGLDIMAVGSPHGFENNVTFGTIGSLNRRIYNYTNAPDYIFVDLSAFPGNSGCPIVNINNGKVIGMLTAIVSDVGEYGLNAGLSSIYLEQFLKDIK